MEYCFAENENVLRVQTVTSVLVVIQVTYFFYREVFIIM